MKKRIIYTMCVGLLVVFRLNAQVCESSQNFTLCSGQTQTLEVLTFMTGSTFSWSLNLQIIPGQTTNKLIVSKITDKQITENYKCDVKLNGTIYETHSFTVTINPYTPIAIQSDHLCEGELATFWLTSPEEYKELEWTINKNYFSKNDTTSWLCGTKPLNVSLSMTNQYGCISTYNSTFQVNLNPNGQIEKTRLITDQYFMNNVDCGNTIGEYAVSGLTGNSKVSKWSIMYDGSVIKEITSGTTGKIVPNDKRFFEWIEIKDATTLRVKWKKLSQMTYNMIIRAATSNGDCSFNSDFSTILISDYSPDADTIIQKPKKSNVLIFPSGQNRTDLNYQWGYTTPGGNEKTIKGNKFYVEVTDPAELNPANRYWVETWYSSNSFCRNRTYAATITK
jgi:hypothetical protein